MKFLCEHCKAKYQIADEKVAGRTVRMKCRKCGNPIEVRAAVTETSVSIKAPETGGDAPRPPTRPAPPRAKPLATNLSHTPSTAAKAASVEQQGALVGAFHRNVQQADEQAPASMDLRELSAADEWYVAVNGVPVGPVRVGEVRRKAATGAVTEDSLCWQEGMEEWRTIRTVTELAAVVREAASGGKSHHPEPGRPAPPPARARISTVPIAPKAAGLSPPHAAHAGSLGFSSPQGGGLGRTPAPPRAALTPRMGLAAEVAEEENVPTIVGRSPLLDDDDQTTAGPTDPSHPMMTGNGIAAARVADPFALPAPSFTHDPFVQAAPHALAGPPVAAVEAQPPAPVPPIVVNARRGPPPYIAIAMIAMGCCFAITAAIVLLRPPVVIAAAPVAPAPSAVPAPTVAVRPTENAGTVPTEPVAAPTVDAGAKVATNLPRPAGPAGTSGPASNQKPNAGGSPTDPALAALIAGTGNGPSTSSGGGGPSGAQLNEDDVKRVVGTHSVAVKRTCWDRISTQTSSVNVTVRVNVGGSGQVSSATATGNDPVVAHCLEEEVRGWRFPGAGVAEIPFHFIRQ